MPDRGAQMPLMKRCARCGRVSGRATFGSDGGLCHRCESGTQMPLTSPPFDVFPSPHSRRLDVRAARAALPAGAFGTVGDDASSEDAEGVAVARDANRDYSHGVEHVRQSRLARWQEQR